MLGLLHELRPDHLHRFVESAAPSPPAVPMMALLRLVTGGRGNGVFPSVIPLPLILLWIAWAMRTDWMTYAADRTPDMRRLAVSVQVTRACAKM